MVKIDTIVFEILGGGAFKATPPPPPGSLTVWNSPDRIGLNDGTQHFWTNYMPNPLPPPRSPSLQ